MPGLSRRRFAQLGTIALLGLAGCGDGGEEEGEDDGEDGEQEGGEDGEDEGEEEEDALARPRDQ